jgi:acetyltransferase
MALGEDPGIDAVIAYALHEPAALRPVDVLPAAARRLNKPILFGTMGPGDEIAPVTRALRAEGIYVAEAPEPLARAAFVLAEDAARQARLAHPNAGGPDLATVQVPRACDEHAAKQVLEAIGIRAPRRAACASHEEAHEAFGQLAKPVVVKILSVEVEHKTEVDGVQLNVDDESALHRALAELDEIPLDFERRYLVEEMAPPGLEVIVGAVRDASFGPTVMVGMGGTLAEALDDTALRLAPLRIADALEMLDELRSAPLFDGFRGSPGLDRTALALAIVSLGNLLSKHHEIEELEINPLRVYPTGVLALDALLISVPVHGDRVAQPILQRIPSATP